MLSWDEEHQSNVSQSPEATLASKQTSSGTLSDEKSAAVSQQSAQDNISSDIHPGAIIAPLLKKYPYLKDFLISLNPKYSRLSNPVVFNTMGNIATLDMIAARGGYATEEFLDILRKEVKQVEGESNMDGDSNRK